MPANHPIVRSRKLDRLITEAKNLARERGHEPTNARLHPSGKSAIIDCSNKGCRAWVQVNTHVKPNEINIGGPAIAAGCPHP